MKALALAAVVGTSSALACSSDPALISIAAVGDSITQGAHSTGGNHTWPGQLQIMLDDKYSGKYCVENLGEGGATLQHAPHGDSPYWKRGSFGKLTSRTWDLVVIMLGTNDAKDACGEPASFCNAAIKPPLNSCCNWPHAGQTNWTQDCTDLQCPFAQDYASLIALVKTLGRTNGSAPTIWLAAPPPLVNGGSPGSPAKPYGMNQTVINDVFPALLPRISSANGLPHPVIDVFGCVFAAAPFPPLLLRVRSHPSPPPPLAPLPPSRAMGGTSGLECGFPQAGADNNFLCSHKCVQDQHTPGCALQCDTQSCDPCHPNNEGYTALAAAVMKGMGL